MGDISTIALVEEGDLEVEVDTLSLCILSNSSINLYPIQEEKLELVPSG